MDIISPNVWVKITARGYPEDPPSPPKYYRTVGMEFSHRILYVDSPVNEVIPPLLCAKPQNDDCSVNTFVIYQNIDTAFGISLRYFDVELAPFAIADAIEADFSKYVKIRHYGGCNSWDKQAHPEY